MSLTNSRHSSPRASRAPSDTIRNGRASTPTALHRRACCPPPCACRGSNVPGRRPSSSPRSAPKARVRHLTTSIANSNACERPRTTSPKGTGDARAPFKLDQLLATPDERRPVLAEVKINDDEDAVYALVQVLAAAAYLSSPAQRHCIRLHYGSWLDLPDAGPYFDLRVVLSRDRGHPLKGARIECLRQAMSLAATLVRRPEVAAVVRDIAFVESWLEDGRLSFAPAGPTPTLGDPSSRRPRRESNIRASRSTSDKMRLVC